MADREGDQNDASAQDCSSSIPNDEPNDESCEQETPAEPSARATTTSQVRNTVLEKIATHQAKLITQLERTLEKKQAIIKRLSAPPPIPHPAMPMVPPTAMPVPPVPAGSQSASVQTTSAGAPQASIPTPSTSIPVPPGLPPHSQPQSLQTPGAHNPALATPLVGFPPPQPHMAAGYPYMFPHPDPSFAAPFMGVLPTTAMHPIQPPQSRATKQSAQKDKTINGPERKQSRYWTQDEHDRFLAGVKACGPKNYTQISEYVGTRNAKQVRTHAQKFQKKREREEAKLRNDMRHGGTVVGPMASVEEVAEAAVEAAAEAAMQGKVPGATTPIKDSDSTGTHAGPSSSSSGKQCHSSHHQSQGACSVDGSTSTNTAAERNAENSGEGHRNSTSAAAAAAVAAEAVALGRGVLPSVALEIAPKMFLGAAEKASEGTANKSMEAERPKTEAVEIRPCEAQTTGLTNENSGQGTDKAAQINESGNENTTESVGRIQTSGTRVDGVSTQSCTGASTTQCELKQKASDLKIHKSDEKQSSAAEHESSGNKASDLKAHKSDEKQSSTTEHESSGNKNVQSLSGGTKQMGGVKNDETPRKVDEEGGAVATKVQIKEARQGDQKNGKQGDVTSVSPRRPVEGTMRSAVTVKSEPKCVDALTKVGEGSEAAKDGTQKGDERMRKVGERPGEKTENDMASGAWAGCAEQGKKVTVVTETEACGGSGDGEHTKALNTSESQRKAGSQASIQVETGDSSERKTASDGGDETRMQVEKAQTEMGVGGGSQEAGHDGKGRTKSQGRKRAADVEDERKSKRARREEGSVGKEVEMREEGGGGKGSSVVGVAQSREGHGGTGAVNGVGTKAACR